MRNLRSHHMYRPRGNQQLNVARSASYRSNTQLEEKTQSPPPAAVPSSAEPLSDLEAEFEFLQSVEETQDHAGNPQVSINALHIADHPTQGW